MIEALQMVAWTLGFVVVYVAISLIGWSLPGQPPLADMVFCALFICRCVWFLFVERNTVNAAIEAGWAARFAYDVWQWWKRRRRPLASRLLARIGRRGNRLVVVPVRAGGR